MTRKVARFGKSAARTAGPILLRREMVVFLPAIALAGLWFGLAAMTLIGATAVMVAWMTRPLGAAALEEDASTGLPLREAAEQILSQRLQEADDTGCATACLVLGLDDVEGLSRRLGADQMAQTLRRAADRLHGTLREDDRIARLSGARFAILLKPTPRLDLEGLIQLSARLQSAAEAPLSIGQQTIHITVHIGFCQPHHLPDPTAKALICAAEDAAEDAARHGTGAIRAYGSAQRPPQTVRTAPPPDVAAALEAGEIQTLFQPHMSTDTGEVSGFDVVGFWSDPNGTELAGTDLTAAIAAAGVQERFGEVMLQGAVQALKAFDRIGAPCPAFCLPVTEAQFADPTFSSRLRWELDRFDVTPARIRLILPIDLLAERNDGVVFHNFAECSALGCAFDLAGFGDSPLTLNRLRQLIAPRLRIDPSLAHGLNCDPSQQRLVSAIVSLADGLGLETLAECVGSIADHTMLAQLGCRHVQGSAIAHPMPLQDTFTWLDRHREKLNRTPGLSHRAKG